VRGDCQCNGAVYEEGRHGMRLLYCGDYSVPVPLFMQCANNIVVRNLEDAWMGYGMFWSFKRRWKVFMI